MIDCAFDGNSKATEDFLRFSNLKHYWRFQGNLDWATKSIDSVSKRAITGLEQIGHGIAINREGDIFSLIEELRRAGTRIEAKINWPHKGMVVCTGRCLVNGSVDGYTSEALYLFTGGSGRYWPSARIIPNGGQWQGEVNLGIESPQGTIVLAAVDQRLTEFIEFYRSHRQVINYPGMPIVDFPSHLDSVHVIVDKTLK